MSNQKKLAAGCRETPDPLLAGDDPKAVALDLVQHGSS
jgi:hypothetical protein